MEAATHDDPCQDVAGCRNSLPRRAAYAQREIESIPRLSYGSYTKVSL